MTAKNKARTARIYPGEIDSLKQVGALAAASSLLLLNEIERLKPLRQRPGFPEAEYVAALMTVENQANIMARDCASAKEAK